MEAYIDIETTGLSELSQITVIGIFLTDGINSRFVQMVGDDITADKLLEALKDVNIVYSYNGSRFDLPVIHFHLGVNLEAMYQHCDLMYDCWRNNLYGGLKVVEQKLGVDREIKGISGYDAVRLWWRYQNDYDEEALKTLLAYNREDVVNLKTLKEKLLCLSETSGDTPTRENNTHRPD